MAKYGSYGGAISITDPKDGKTELIENPLGEQAIAGLAVNDSQIYRDFNLEQTPASAELPELLKRVDGYLCEIKEAQIRDGLHILGRLPEGDQLVDLLFSLVREDL